MNLEAAGGGKHTDGSTLPSVLFGGAGGGSDSRGLKRLLKGLSSDDDVAVLDCLTQLCDLITYNADESVLASGFSGGQHINDLVRLLGSPDPTVQLMCVKILTQIFDQLPPIMGLAVQAGISEALTEKLLAIEYMDVAELAISAIEKISAVYPQALVGCGGLGALLVYLDFFPTSIQRLAMRTVANLCSKVPMQHDGQLIDAAPALTTMLGHSDCKMVEKSALALLRAVDSLAASAELGERRQKVEAMAAHGLVSQTINLLATAFPENASAALVEMTPSLVELLLRLLARLARYSPSLCAEMAEQKLPSIIHGLLVAEMGEADVAVDRAFERQGSIGTESSSPTTRRRSRSMGGSPGIGERGSELICRLLIVLQELLPPLPLDVHPLARGRESATTSEAEGRGPVEKTPCFVRVVHPSGATYWTDGDHGGAGQASTHPTNGMLGLGTILRSTGRTAGGCVKRYFCTGSGWVYERNREDGELLVELIDVDSEDAMTSSEAMHKLLMEHDTSEPMVALIPLLVELHRCAVSWPLKALCESIIHQALCHLPSAALEVLKEDSRTVSQLSGLVGRLVSWRVGHGLSTVTGLRLALILLQKAPQEFCESLAREGLIAMASSHAARESFGGRSADTDAAPTDRGAMSPLTLPLPLTSAFSSACTSPAPSELSVGSPFRSPSCSFLARRLSRSSQPDAHTVSCGGGANVLDELLKDEIEALSLRLVKEHAMATARCAATSDPENSCCLLAGTSSVLDSLTAAAKLLQVNGRAQTLEARAKVAEALSHVAAGIAGMPSAQRTLALLDCAWSSRGADESQEQTCTGALEQLCTLLWGRKGMSTFELASSGMVPALMAYLTASEELVDDVSVAPVLATTEGKALLGMQLKLLRRERARAFMRVMLLNRDVGANSSSSTSSSSPLYRSRSLSLGGSGAETPLERLLWQLQACLAASDLFPLVLSTAAQQDGPHGGAKTAATQLNQPLRLRIRCATADADTELQAYLQGKGLCTFSVMIDPLASVRGIREYLERRFAASDPSTLADAERDRLWRRQARMEARAAAAGSTPPPKIAAEGEGASEEDDEDDDDDDEEELMYEDDDDEDDEEADVEEEDMQEEEEDQEETEEMCGKDVKDVSAAKATSRLSRFRLPFRSQTSPSPSPKTEEGSGGASASEAGASSSEKSLPRTGSGRSVGKSPVFSPRSAKASETAPTATKAFEPSQRYDMRSFVIKINGVQPHLEETPILELAYTSMAARGTSGNSSGSLDLWAATHEVEWIVRPKSSSSPAVTSPTAAKSNSVTATSASSTSGSSAGGTEEKVCGAQHGEEEPKAEVVPSWWVAHPIDEYLTEADPLLQHSCMGKSGMVSQGEEEYDVMRLLRLLYGLNRHVSSLMGPGPEGAVASVLALRQEAWCNKTLSERLALQLKDPLALAVRSLPPWCEQLLRVCPFLFPLKVRTEWFYSTSFGLSRALHRMSLRAAAEAGGRGSHHHNRSFSGGPGGGGGAARGLAGAVQHLKVRVSRSRLLESADMVLGEYARRRVLIEVEFQNEPGTGSGPTAEFFTLVSQELQKPQQGMWRAAAGGNLGLFPRATSAAPSDDVLKKFKCLGRLVGQALLDERLLDIRLTAPLLSVMTGRRTCTSLPAALNELAGLDPTFSFQITKLASSCGVLSMSLSPSSFEGDASTLGASAVDDMCLTFCLPGEDVVPLVGGSLGADTPVTLEKMGLYVQRVLEVALRDGVKAQMDALLEGLHDVVPPGALWLFTEEELMTMIAGVGSEMGNDPQDILEAIACDHGYTRASRAVRWLVEILAEMAPEEQRRFLMFVTGSPCLPVGGLRGCNPRLTVVRKVGASGSVGQSEVDVMLPSASTCTNYLKLPEYSSREVMRERLLCSVVHGQHSFHLS